MTDEKKVPRRDIPVHAHEVGSCTVCDQTLRGGSGGEPTKGALSIPFYYKRISGGVEPIYEPRPTYEEKTAVKPENDSVNHPAHYTDGGIETLDYIKAKLTPDAFRGFLQGNILKYISRAGKKDNSLEDCRKAAFYLDRLIKDIEERG